MSLSGGSKRVTSRKKTNAWDWLTGRLASAIGIVTLLGGSVWYLGKPPYANEDWTKQQIAGLELQYNLGREDSLERRVFDLEVQKRKMGRDWPDFMEKELQRLQAELMRVKDQLRQYKK